MWVVAVLAQEHVCLLCGVAHIEILRTVRAQWIWHSKSFLVRHVCCAGTRTVNVRMSQGEKGKPKFSQLVIPTMFFSSRSFHRYLHMLIVMQCRVRVVV